MLFSKGMVFVDLKDLEIDITERVVIGKHRNAISLFDVKIKHLPTNISQENKRYLEISEMIKGEQLFEILEKTFSRLSRLHKQKEGHYLEINLSEFYTFFDSLEQDYLRNPNHFSSEPEFDVSKWDFILDKVGKVNYKKSVEDFFSRDKVFLLDKKMKNYLESGDISEDCYNLFKNSLIDLELIDNQK